jgi:Zn-dependent metalloprotease
LVFAVFLSNIFAQQPPTPNQIKAQQVLNEKFQQQLKLIWNNKNGSPEIISFNTPIVFDRNQKTSAVMFLQEIRNLVNCQTKQDTFILIKSNENKGKKYFRFQQHYNGVKVKGGEYVVTVLPYGNVKTALGSFYKNINVDTKPKISDYEALQIALQNSPKETPLKEIPLSSELILYPTENSTYLAYEIHIDGKRDGEAWRYIIDAHEGSLLDIRSDIIYASKAYVYPRHPILDASYTYISPVAHLTGNGYIQGTYAYILNDEASVAYNASNDFRYATSNTHFDEANLYYHIDKIGTYFNSKGFDEVTQITAHAHHDFFDEGQPDPQGSYDPSDHHLRFSDGQGVSGYNSFAREDKMIYHEYTHAVTDFVSDLIYAFTESGAIHEGNSDYFAGSFTNRTLICEYACQGFSDIQREMTNPRITTYSEYMDRTLSYWLQWDYHEPHFGGELWSACLWDLHDELNATTTDEIVFDGLYAIPTSCTFLQYRQAIIDADIDNNNGANVTTIQNVFHSRGIGTGVTLSGPLQENETWYGSITLQNNVAVPSGIALNILSGATINLGSFTVTSTGGTINIASGAIINGSAGRAALRKSGSTILGIYPTVQAAINSAASYNTVYILPGNHNESNITVSGKNNLYIEGDGSTPFINGTLTFYYCNYLSLSSFDCNQIIAAYCNQGFFHSQVGGSSSQTAVALYNCSGFNQYGYVFSSNIGLNASASSGYVPASAWYDDNTTSILSTASANVVVNDSRLCESITYDFRATQNGYLYALDFYCRSDGPRYLESGGTIDIDDYSDCSLAKASAAAVATNDIPTATIHTQSNDPAKVEFSEINQTYFTLLETIRKDVTENSFSNKEKLHADHTDIMSNFKNYILKYPESSLAKVALTTVVNSLRLFDDYEVIKNLLDEIASDEKLVALKALAGLYMPDYYKNTKNVETAVNAADAFILSYEKDTALLCDALLKKGLMLSYELNQPEKAAACFAAIIDNYPDNPLANFA